MRLTDNIRALVDAVRKERGISLNALAREIGINQPTLLRIYEGESKEPKLENLAKIARYFRVKSVDDLYHADLTGDRSQQLDLLPSSNTQSEQSEVIFTPDNVVSIPTDAAWPFARVPVERIRALDAEQLGFVQGRLLSALEEVEADVARTRPSKRAS